MPINQKDQLNELPDESLRPESQPSLDTEQAELKSETEQGPQEQQPVPTETVSKPKARLPSLRRPIPKIPNLKDEVTVKIEKIMEDGLGDAFSRLSPIAQQEFKIKGEQTANKINELLRATHIKVKKIFRLIVEWLRILPGVNRFFLEQEAKIKTDKIIELFHNKKQE